jgi:hypothetical protein
MDLQPNEARALAAFCIILVNVCIIFVKAAGTSMWTRDLFAPSDDDEAPAPQPAPPVPARAVVRPIAPPPSPPQEARGLESWAGWSDRPARAPEPVAGEEGVMASWRAEHATQGFGRQEREAVEAEPAPDLSPERLDESWRTSRTSR